MQRDPVGSAESIARAIEAADHVFNRRRGDPGSPYEPADAVEADAAVRRFGERFSEIPGAIAEALEAGYESGTLLSSDPLQGLSEMVQNADDVEASEVRLLLRPSDLLVSHDGSPVELDHVLGLATPWLSTKSGDPTALGRFGVGLSTLRSLSATLEVHCDPYHVQIGNPNVAPVQPADVPPWFTESGWTTLRIPLQAGRLKSSELEAWLGQWDDDALLFLRHVARITLFSPGGNTIRQLGLARSAHERIELGLDSKTAASRCVAEAADGRSWAVYNAEVPSPAGVSRAHKATGSTTTIAVALPLQASAEGQVYAGLPVAHTRLPIFASAQFDPLTNRADFGDTPWNSALVPLVASLWSEAALDLFAQDPRTAWEAVPLPVPDDQETPSPVVGPLEAAMVGNARRVVASRLSLSVPGQGHVNLSQLAVEGEPLELVLQPSETATLARLPAALPTEARDATGRWRAVLEDWRAGGADLPEPVDVAQALDIVGDPTRPVPSTIALVAAALEEELDWELSELPCVVAHDGRRLIPPAWDSAHAVATELPPLGEQLGTGTALHPAYLASGQGAPRVLAWLQECGALLDEPSNEAVVRRIAKAGRQGNPLEAPLTDDQARALRDVLEQMDPTEWERLGPDLGRAFSLESYTYDRKGHKEAGTAPPADAYTTRDRTGAREFCGRGRQVAGPRVAE